MSSTKPRCPHHGRNPTPACLKCEHSVSKINNDYVQRCLAETRVDNSIGLKQQLARREATMHLDASLWDEGSW